MSARVFNPMVMSEMRRMIGRSSSDGSGTTAAVVRVKRDLFGPVNHEDAQVFVEKELAVIRQREAQRWGFDFEKGKPSEVESTYKWERVSPNENIPEAYAMRRLLALGQTQTETASSRDSTTDRPSSTTTQKSKQKQSQITDFMRCRKRSLSVGDLSRKTGNAGDIASPRRIQIGLAAKRSRQ